MATLLDSKFGVGLVCVLCAAAGAAGVAYLRGDALQQPPAASVKAASWDGPLGPGALPASPSGGGEAFAAAAGEPHLVDTAGRLKVDAELHQLFDGYLKTAAPREQELRAYLRRRLQQPALAQAEQLAGDYLRYLRAEAALRASERIAPPDPSGMSAKQLEQMEAWLLQRSQLRERMLGTAVAQAWFGTGDADCRTALADWRLMLTPSDAEDLSPGELRDRRVHGAMLEQRRNERAQSCAAELTERLAANGPAA